MGENHAGVYFIRSADNPGHFVRLDFGRDGTLEVTLRDENRVATIAISMKPGEMESLSEFFGNPRLIERMGLSSPVAQASIAP